MALIILMKRFYNEGKSPRLAKFLPVIQSPKSKVQSPSPKSQVQVHKCTWKLKQIGNILMSKVLVQSPKPKLNFTQHSFLVQLGKGNPPHIFTWRQPPGYWPCFIQMSHWSDWICLLWTISISLIPILYFLRCFKFNAPLAVALVITIIRHKSYVIDHTSQTIGHRR